MTNTKKITKLAGTNPTSVRDLMQRCELLGCEVVQPRHFRVMRDGRTIATVSSTPSDSRALFNAMRDLRRAGVDVRTMRIS